MVVLLPAGWFKNFWRADCATTGAAEDMADGVCEGKEWGGEREKNMRVGKRAPTPTLSSYRRQRGRNGDCHSTLKRGECCPLAKDVAQAEHEGEARKIFLPALRQSQERKETKRTRLLYTPPMAQSMLSCSHGYVAIGIYFLFISSEKEKRFKSVEDQRAQREEPAAAAAVRLAAQEEQTTVRTMIYPADWLETHA